MSDIAIDVHNLSKMYQLGEVGTGTISHDLNRWWARVRGKEDPYAQVGQVNDRTQKAVKDELVWAIKDINFQVKRGEVMGIIGKNGAGKSTLLKVISQITAPSTGEIRFNGRIASLLEVGTGMHPELTGRENVFLNGAILGMTKAEIKAKFDDIMDFAGCTKYADTPVKRYSSGMMVRLGFAVAAFLEPEILIVDEVLAVGDAEFQRRAIGKMQEISSGGGRTVLFVSHNMSSVKSLCSNTLMLEHGQLSMLGPTDAVILKYLNSNSYSGFKEVAYKGVVLKDLHFLTSSSQGTFKTSELIMQEPCELVLEMTSENPIWESNILVEITDTYGIKATTIGLPEEGIGSVSFKDRLKIRINVENLTLMPGSYKVSLTLWKNGTNHKYFEAQNAFSFNVVPNTVNGASTQYQNEHGLFRMPVSVEVDA